MAGARGPLMEAAAAAKRARTRTRERGMGRSRSGLPGDADRLGDADSGKWENSTSDREQSGPISIIEQAVMCLSNASSWGPHSLV